MISSNISHDVKIVNIQTANNHNFDVRGNSKTFGAHLIIWTPHNGLN